jgi:hypothetical protein
MFTLAASTVSSVKSGVPILHSAIVVIAVACEVPPSRPVLVAVNALVGAVIVPVVIGVLVIMFLS